MDRAMVATIENPLLPPNIKHGRYVEAVAKLLWPKYPARGLARALGVPHYTARDWISGYRAMPVDRVMELLGIFNSVFCSVRRGLEDHAVKRAEAVKDESMRARGELVAVRQKARQAAASVEL